MADLLYQPPGVLIDESAATVPTMPGVISLPPSRVAIVGPASGYRTASEVFTMGATGVDLANVGVDTTTVEVTSLSGTPYVLTTDYTVAEVGAVPEDAVTTITRVGAGSIPLNSTVMVRYQYTDTDYYLPYYATDWDSVQSRYGVALRPDGTIASPLSLAAKIAMEQGVRDLVLVPTKGSTPDLVSATQLSSATQLLSSRTDIGLVVPLPIGIAGTDGSPGETTQVVTDLRNNIDAAITDGSRRIGLIGLDRGAVRSLDTMANSVNAKRIVLAYPSTINWWNGYTNKIMEIGGCYLAAAYAGRLAAQSPQTPLTRKFIASFSSIPARIATTMTMTAKNALSSSGVSVTEQTTDGRLVVRHGVTTNMSTVLTREISIIRAQDTMLSTIEQSLESSGMIGEALTANSPLQIRSIVEGALLQVKNAGVIIDYSNLAIRQSSADPTVMEIKFAYDPAYPLNRVVIGFTINTSTGQFTEGITS